jgi:chromosome segregation ATPase
MAADPARPLPPAVVPADQHLLDEERRLHDGWDALARQQASWLESTRRREAELTQAWQELRRQQEQFQAERDEAERERALAQRHWRRRWEAEWERLRRESARLASAKQALARETTEKATELELARRHLESSWGQLRREQQEWRQYKQKEEAHLHEASQTLDDRRRALQKAEDAWELEQAQYEAARARRLEEIEGLEGRIRAYRRKLAGLHAEAARVEGDLLEPAKGELLPAAAPPGAVPGHDLDRFVAELVAGVQDCIDQQRRLQEQYQLMQSIRRGWLTEMDQALAELARREEAVERQEDVLFPREEAVRRAEKEVRRRADALARREQHLATWEARLWRQQSSFQCERSRALAVIRARAAALRQRAHVLAGFRKQAAEERRREQERIKEDRLACEAARQDYLRLRDKCRERLAQLVEERKEVLARELVLAHAREKLLEEDADPAASAAELDRQFQHLLSLADHPARQLQALELELERRLEQVELFRRTLLDEQEALDRRREEFAQEKDRFGQVRMKHEAERIKWTQELAALQGERDSLERHLKDLNEQLENLTVVLMESHRPDPPLAAVAIAA